MTTDPKEIIQRILQFKETIVQMDLKIRNYLSDRQYYPHPFPEDLITEIRNFEKRNYRVNNKEVQLHLEGLLSSLYAYEQSWNKLFENDLEKSKQRE